MSIARKRGGVIAALSLSLVAVLIPATSAFADGGSTPPPSYPGRQSAVNNVPLTAQHATGTGGVSTNSVPIQKSPGGCYGQTDNAHKSGSSASVHGRTRCAFPVDQLGVTTYLWNLAWFGWVDLNNGSSSRTAARDSQDATPHSTCASTGPHSFFGSSDHYSVEGGSTYTGSTSSPTQVFNC